MGTDHIRASRGAGVVLGLVTACVAIGVAHLVAGIVSPDASPLVAVGRVLIDGSPQWLKTWAISTFGTADKPLLLAGIGFVLAVVSMALGVVAARRAAVGPWAIAALGAIGVVAALTRPGSGPLDSVPAVVGAVVAAGVFGTLRARLAPPGPAEPEPAERPRLVDRRRFLVLGAAGLGAAAVAGGVGSFLARRFRADASRADVRIPAPDDPAPSLASGLETRPAGLEPFFTPNARFYRVDTALIVPSVEAEDWRLRVLGMVERELTLDYEELVGRPLIERDITLACVSNPIGGSYVGNARWIGAPLRDLLLEAGVEPGADQLVSRSADGFTAGTPTAVAMDGRDAMLAVAMNGEPLPIEHGFPVRMVVPGLYGYVSATKWLVDLELTTFDAYDAYWVRRGWAEQAPVKTMSRIDTPSSGDVDAGMVTVAGVAWAQHRGIERVEVRISDGPWVEAELAERATIDTWRQWVYQWDAAPGDYLIAVRATDGDGETQTPDRAEPFPAGATGHHAVTVHVE